MALPVNIESIQRYSSSAPNSHRSGSGSRKVSVQIFRYVWALGEEIGEPKVEHMWLQRVMRILAWRWVISFIAGSCMRACRYGILDTSVSSCTNGLFNPLENLWFLWKVHYGKEV